MADEFYYRYADYLRGTGGVDMCGEWEPGPAELRVHVRRYRVVKKTPKGAWIVNAIGDRQLVLDHWFNKFANPTREGARQDFLARKRKLIAIQERRIRDARIAIATAERNEFESLGLAGLPTELKPVRSWEGDLPK